MTSPLDNVSVVLVEPRGPLNVGAAARAMKNFGLGKLAIVGASGLDIEAARTMAVRSQEVLENARRVATLEEALSDVALVIGTTARMRHRRPTRTPREAVSEILRCAARDPVAILFGREDHGLFKDELIRCHRVISVPTSHERTSLNLAQAVVVVAYELFQGAPLEAASADSGGGNLIAGEQWDRLYGEVIACCEDTGYLGDGNRHAIEQSFRRLLKLGPIQTRDARHLFGLVRRVDKILTGRAAPRRTPPPRGAD